METSQYYSSCKDRYIHTGNLFPDQLVFEKDKTDKAG